MRACSVIALLLIGYGAQALKCRGQDNGSEAEFKRITRTCMRKVGEATSIAATGSQNVYNSASYNNHNNNNNRVDQQKHQHMGNHQMDDASDENYHNQQPSYGYYQLMPDDMTVQRNRQTYNRQTRPANANSGGASNDRSGGRTNAQNGHGNGNGKSYRNSNQTYSAHENCMAHCFFGELNTLNNDDHPDRQKVMYALTKDLRDRELRNFYHDTIGECFHYMESQRRGRDGKCHYANELVRCMTAYAKANCEDWQDNSNIVFN